MKDCRERLLSWLWVCRQSDNQGETIGRKREQGDHGDCEKAWGIRCVELAMERGRSLVLMVKEEEGGQGQRKSD